MMAIFSSQKSEITKSPLQQFVLSLVAIAISSSRLKSSFALAFA